MGCHGFYATEFPAIIQNVSPSRWSLASHLTNSWAGFHVSFPKSSGRRQGRQLWPARTSSSIFKQHEDRDLGSGSVWSEKKNFWRPNMIWLVVYLPLWKVWVSWDDEIPNIWKNNPDVPNHQSVMEDNWRSYCKDNWRQGHFTKQSRTCGTNKCCHYFTRTVRNMYIILKRHQCHVFWFYCKISKGTGAWLDPLRNTSWDPAGGSTPHFLFTTSRLVWPFWGNVKNYLPAKQSTRGARTHPKAAEGICVISIVFNCSTLLLT